MRSNLIRTTLPPAQAAILAAAASVVMAAPHAARAQTANPTPPAKVKYEEVVVTAQKRSENVRKVPLSITVLSGKQIKADHIQNFADLTRAVPNLSFSSQAGEGLATLELRGIASQAGTATVALYLDDVSLTTRNLSTQGTAEPRFLDIARVEVLRGPQSTLYGASALGGTLKYISNPPNPTKTEGSLFSEVSGTDHGSVNWDEQGVLNIPLITNQLTLRMSGETGGDSGYITQIRPSDASVIKSGINSDAFDVARASLLWQPTDWLTITPSTFFQRAITRDVDAQYLTLPGYETPKTVAEPGRDTLIVPSLTVKADLGFADLIAVTGNYERQFTRTLDSTIYDNLALYVCDIPQTGIACNPNATPSDIARNSNIFNSLNFLPSQTFYSNTVRQWSQEIRLVSKPYVPGEFPFTWIAGLYYSDEHTTATDTEYVDGAQKVFNQYGVSGDDPNIISIGFPGSFQGDNVYHGLTGYDTAQYSVFGETTYYPMENVRLTAGGRYQFSRDSEFTSQTGLYSYGDEGVKTDLGHFFAFTPKFAAGWDITTQNTLYANVSKGFRLGSENRPIEFLPQFVNVPGTPTYDLALLGLHGAPTTFGPDKVWNFEIGDKARLFGGRLIANVDAFYILWNGIQQNIPLVTSGLEFETNAGNGKSYGAEFEFRGSITPDLTAGFSGSVLKATLDNGIAINDHLVYGTSPGEDIPGVPKFNLNVDAKQNFDINDTTTGFVAFNVPWVGSSHGSPIGSYTDPTSGQFVAANPDFNRPSYVTFDASAGIDYGRWEVTLFGKNLTNNKQIIQRPDIQGSASPLYDFVYLGQSLRNFQGFTVRPLTVGMNVNYKF
jgi:outer membrane receptor protein involved in Fe transport